MTLTVIRDGAEQKIDVELGARPTSSTAAAEEPSQGDQGKGQGNDQGRISARAAIAIAEDAAKQKGLTGDATGDRRHAGRAGRRGRVGGRA